MEAPDLIRYAGNIFLNGANFWPIRCRNEHSTLWVRIPENQYVKTVVDIDYTIFPDSRHIQSEIINSYECSAVKLIYSLKKLIQVFLIITIKQHK